MGCKSSPFLEEMRTLYHEIAAATCRGRKRDDPLRIYLKRTIEELTAACLVATLTPDREEIREMSMMLFVNLQSTVRILFQLGMRGDVAASNICGFLLRCTEVQCSLLSVFSTANHQSPTANFPPNRERIV